jgi:hypothetical protein
VTRAPAKRQAASDTDSTLEDEGSQSRTLNDGMTFAALTSQTPENDGDLGGTVTPPAQDAHSEQWSAPIVFYPNGRASNARIRLAGPRDFFVDVTLRGLTGTATISELQRIKDPE